MFHGLVDILLASPSIGIVAAAVDVNADMVQDFRCLLVGVLMDEGNLRQGWVTPVQDDIEPVAFAHLGAIVRRDGNGVRLDGTIEARTIGTNARLSANV